MTLAPPVRVLIVKLGAIGDVIMAIAAVDALRRSLAPASVAVDWIAARPLVPLLTGYSWLRVIPADEQAILHGSPAARLRALAPVWRELRGGYDLAATLYYDPRYRLLSLPARARRRITLSRTDRAFTLLSGRHHTDEFARILLNAPDSCSPTSLPPLRPDHLPPSPLPAPALDRTRIALVPGGAANTLRQQTLRRWPLESYVALASVLLERGHELVLLGGPDDRWTADAFAHLRSPRLLDTIGSLSLPEVIATADTCRLVVTHDTGPLHLAALSTAAIVALFGPTDPGSFLPRRPGVFSIWGGEGFSCRPCYDGVNFAPCASNGCMQQISPAMVLDGIDRALAFQGSTDSPLDPVPAAAVWPVRLVPSQLAPAAPTPESPQP